MCRTCHHVVVYHGYVCHDLRIAMPYWQPMHAEISHFARDFLVCKVCNTQHFCRGSMFQLMMPSHEFGRRIVNHDTSSTLSS